MQTFEFRATAIDGIIRIPKEYAKKIGSEVKVVLYSDVKTDTQDKTPRERRPLMDLAGVFSKFGDIDLEESRAERLKKYENPN